MAISSERDKQDAEKVFELERNRLQAGPLNLAYRFPWWALILLIIGVYVLIASTADQDYSRIFRILSEGIVVTLRISVIGYIIAAIIGLFVGLIRANPPAPSSSGRFSLFNFLHLILYNISTLYVEVMRGLPIAIVILVTAFVIAPPLKEALQPSVDAFNQWFAAQPLSTWLAEELDVVIEIELPRSGSEPTVTMGLALAYGAFLSEVFRAGIVSIERGQREAARALGLTYIQSMRHVVLPQAIRRVLPTLGNDFIAIIKDSSLAALVGVQEITQLARTYSGSSFKYVQTYLVVSMIYLTMTIIGSVLVQLMERYLKTSER